MPLFNLLALKVTTVLSDEWMSLRMQHKSLALKFVVDSFQLGPTKQIKIYKFPMLCDVCLPW
jgi:hypothetical protein